MQCSQTFFQQRTLFLNARKCELCPSNTVIGEGEPSCKLCPKGFVTSSDGFDCVDKFTGCKITEYFVDIDPNGVGGYCRRNSGSF